MEHYENKKGSAMSAPSSWRDLLRVMIRQPTERERLAATMGVNPLTLERWVNGVSIPRLHNVQALLQAIPIEQRLQFHQLLVKDYPALLGSLEADEPGELPSEFFRQVLDARATTPQALRFWTISHQVLQHALHQLDKARLGMAIRVVCCLPPNSDGKVSSLRESEGLGTPPWEVNLSSATMFLGAESLAGYAVMNARPEIIHNLKTELWLPAHRTVYEVSALAAPILSANCIAGCLLFSSTQPNAFLSPSRQSLIHDYTRLIALAFDETAFYRPEQIDLRPMPPLPVQEKYLATFQRRVVALMAEAFATEQILTRAQAEQRVWQQIEAELIQAFADSTQ